MKHNEKVKIKVHLIKEINKGVTNFKFSTVNNKTRTKFNLSDDPKPSYQNLT